MSGEEKFLPDMKLLVFVPPEGPTMVGAEWGKFRNFDTLNAWKLPFQGIIFRYLNTGRPMSM